MSDTDDETHLYHSGYATPPLSPTKTISTDGWLSPRTPASPRKARSCAFIRNIDYGPDSPFFTPPASPTKFKYPPRLGDLAVPILLTATGASTTTQYDDDSPVKRHIQIDSDRALPSSSLTLVQPHTPPTTSAAIPLHDEVPRLSAMAGIACPMQDGSSLGRQRTFHRSLSESLIAISEPRTTPTNSSSETMGTSGIGHVSVYSTVPHAKDSFPPNQLHQIPVRCASSPLRSSQWAARGGLLLSPPRRGQSNTPDRFIACRRPPAVTRESFELNKPSERTESHQLLGRGGRSTGDPFSHHLRRSRRLNDELRGLREAHSMIMGRAGVQRRNPNLAYRRNSLTLGIRQISVGAIWNVGGPSAVSDTVVGVSTGRGGMLGSGTNAPLYTSSFLNRADPEAELEAYERRLALALDVDQTDRVLYHSPTPSIFHGEHQFGSSSRSKHSWRDAAWVRDNVTSGLFLNVRKNCLYVLLTPFEYLDVLRICEGQSRFYLSDTLL